METVKRFADGLLGLAYPARARCAGCGTRVGMPRDWLCEDCRRELSRRWVGTAQPPEGGLFDGAAYSYRYGGPAGGMVRALKYRGVSRLGALMARHMALALEGLQPVDVDCVVAVPMHRRRRAERGFNHAELLARELAARLELPALDALERVRNTDQQARLDDERRRRNMTGAIALRGDVRGRRVLLVDDVCTTGATANACAAALRSGGAAAVFLVCFAVSQPGKDG